MLLLLLGIPFLEFKGFAGFPLSAEKFPRWSFWVGHPGWQFFPFLCVGNQTLGGVSWVGHPGSLASSWWTFSDRWNYLSRNCWRLSSSPRLTWVEFRGSQFLAFLCLGEKLPRWTYLARNCLNLSSSARLSWAKFCEWKFPSFPLSGCKLLRWSFLGGSSLQCSCSFLEFPFWNLRDLLASLCLQRNFLGGVSWVGYPGWQFLAFLCLGEKLPRWTYLARKCWKFSSSARLTWAKFCEWKFPSFPLSGCKLLRWGFLGGSSLQCSCSFLEFPFWNFRDLLASLCLQRNFLGRLSWVGHPGWLFLAFLCLGEKLPRWTYLARKCWNLSSSARLSWAKFCEWKFLSFPLSGCKLLRWSFLGGSSLQCSCSFLEFPFWNFRDLLASLFLQRNVLGGVSGWGILAGNSFLFFVLGTKP